MVTYLNNIFKYLNNIFKCLNKLRRKEYMKSLTTTRVELNSDNTTLNNPLLVPHSIAFNPLDPSHISVLGPQVLQYYRIVDATFRPLPMRNLPLSSGE